MSRGEEGRHQCVRKNGAVVTCIDQVAGVSPLVHGKTAFKLVRALNQTLQPPKFFVWDSGIATGSIGEQNVSD